MLSSACIRSPRTPEQGLRISVMSRHTLNDGLTADSTITPEMYDQWWPELAPPPRLVGAYYKRSLGWPDFEERYRCHLEEYGASMVSRLILYALEKDVTVLCTEREPQQCHRRLLVEYCALLEPSLRISLG